MRRIGVHTSIAGGLHKGLERAHALGCTGLQIFSHNPRGWAVSERPADEAARFRSLRAELDLSPVVIHTSYLINLATKKTDLSLRSAAMLVHEMNLADAIGADYVVVHTGSASGEDPAAARRRAVRSLGEIAAQGRWRARLLLENTAGERGDITSAFSEIAEILHAVGGDLISGICLDTCHAFAAGYDIGSAEGIEALAAEIETFIGRDKVRVVHLNDSRGALGSHVDRHEHIGQGKIGASGLSRFLHDDFFSGIPLILETPKITDADDIRNLASVKALIGTF